MSMYEQTIANAIARADYLPGTREWRVVVTLGDRSEEKVIGAVYEPRCGIDAQDYFNIEMTADELVRSLNPHAA